MELKSPKRKGVFFTVDAMLGLGIIVAVVILASTFYIAEKRVSTFDTTSQDIIGVLSNIRAVDINNSFIQQKIDDGNITRPNSSVLEVISGAWATGNPSLAANITQAVIDQIGLTNINFELSLNSEIIYQQNITGKSAVHTNKRFISGIDKDKPLDGFTSRASLKGSNQFFKTENVHFGGFIGQGNVTRMFELASEITSYKSAKLELDTPSNLTLYLNGNFAGNYTVPSNKQYLEPAQWNISAIYLSNLQPGLNTVKYEFEGTDKYIAGGLLSISYFTNDTSEVGINYESNTSAAGTFWMEGTEGFINTFSAFFVPGELSTLGVFLSFDLTNAQGNAFLKIGNTTVYENGSTGLTEVWITNESLSNDLTANGLSYDDMSLTTIPIRFGLGNLSSSTSNADIVLVNDVSGSMEWCTNQTSQCCSASCSTDWPPGCACGTSGSFCGYDPSANHWNSSCTGGDVKRVGAMRNASGDFVSTVLAAQGPLIGLVSYESTTSSTVGLTDVESTLQNEINTYDADGGTCICCGINSAVAILASTNTTTVIPREDSGWRYLATDPSTPPTDWTNLSFDDSGWSSGDGGLGRGYYNWWHGFEPDTTLTNYNGFYYFRKKFNISDASAVSDSVLSIARDDGVRVYVNDNLVLDNINDLEYASYWDDNNIDVSSYLQDGENVIAVELRNQRNTNGGCWWQCNYFDAELTISESGSADPRFRAMIVMSDGQATQECAEQGTTPDLNGNGNADEPEDDAIQAACDAYNNYGIIIHAVGFGTDADETTLRNISTCAQGDYYSSANVDDLAEVYTDLANIIVEESTTQVVNISGVEGVLNPESFIAFNYTPIVPAPEFGKIPLSAETARFGNNASAGNVTVPGYAELTDMTALTYSAEKWSDNVSIQNSNGQTSAFSLEDFSLDYQQVGDPYRIHISPSIVVQGEQNSVTTKTGIGPGNESGGSPANKIIYDVRVPSSVDFTTVTSRANGCTWNVDFEDDSSKTFDIPTNYNGTNQCFFSNATYDSDDSYNVAFYNLLTQFDFNQNGNVDVILEEGDTEFDTLAVDGVPSLWGPVIVEVQVWK